MTPTTDDLRAAILAAAEEQLIASPDDDIATRAVCEAVGVSQPVLYRIFGDKRGLLDALADAGMERYVALKADQETTADPVSDLLAGWDGHSEFARRHPALYQLMFTPRPWSRSVARRRVFDLLVATLVRCAAAGRLRGEPHSAARVILSANVGVALNAIAQPELFDDPALSHRMRDAVFGHLILDPPADDPVAPDPAAGTRAAALRLHSQLAVAGTDVLEPAETALLDRWLQRLATPSGGRGED